MDRRNFIKNTALAATMVSIIPPTMASGIKPGKKKELIFIFRGVSYTDARNAFNRSNISDTNVHFQKVVCKNQTFSHFEGYDSFVPKADNGKRGGIETQKMERYNYSEIFEDVLSSDLSLSWFVHLHHTEIAHSNHQLYLETLDEFFAALKKAYDPALHKFIITADIGRNEQLNSCGGKDHSDETCLETFALYMGGKASRLTSNTITQDQLLAQKF